MNNYLEKKLSAKLNVIISRHFFTKDYLQCDSETKLNGSVN